MLPDSLSVTCICLTADRQEFTDRAVSSFLAQTYPDCQLLIYDTGVVPYQLPKEHCSIWVTRGTKFSDNSIGELRNLANSATSCDLIAHWDSDDYSSPTRLADQVSRLAATGKSVTGYNCMKFTDPAGEKWWMYQGAPSMALGTSLCYRTDYWRKFPFRNTQQFPQNPKGICEDSYFTTDAWGRRELIVTSGDDMMFATIHEGNSSPKQVSSSNWRRLPNSRHLFPAEAFQL